MFDLQSNLPRVVALMEELKHHTKLRRFMVVSSGGTVYGHATQLPISEYAQTEPVSPYGITKLTIERYKKEKDDIKAEAEKLEAEAKAADRHSEAEMHVHERWALATTLLQIAIALSAITLLTRKRWMLVGVFGATGLGVVAGVMGYLHL